MSVFSSGADGVAACIDVEGTPPERWRAWISAGRGSREEFFSTSGDALAFVEVRYAEVVGRVDWGPTAR